MIPPFGFLTPPESVLPPITGVLVLSLDYQTVGLTVVNWTGVSPTPDGYELWRSTESEAPVLYHTTLSLGLTYGDTGIGEGVTYHYMVRARSGRVVGAFSNILPVFATVSDPIA